ncbi:hypothetical protein BGZ88_007949 [Linnemannia elongata]|nr:hypothetical protein BGZ88_007949 [Linnemannia elongata]
MSTIFDILELTIIIGPYLSTHDLAQCIRVNKAWHTLFTPLLWHSLPPPPPSRLPTPTRRYFFGWDDLRVLLQEDHLLWKQQQQQELSGLSKDDYKEEQKKNSQPYRSIRSSSSSSSSSLLSKYGPFIQKVTLEPTFLKPRNPKTFPWFIIPRSRAELHSIRPPYELPADLALSEPIAPSLPEPTPEELFIHLLKHCPNLRFLELNGWSPDKDHAEFWRVIAHDVVPRLEVLEVGGLFRAVWDGLAMVSCCSPRMRQLRLPEFDKGVWQDVVGASGGAGDGAGGGGGQENTSAWSMFMKNVCLNLESLQIDTVDQGWMQALSRATPHLRSLHIQHIYNRDWRILIHSLQTGRLPHLDSIHINLERGPDKDKRIADGEVAELIKAGQTGWRTIHVTRLGPLSVGALIQQGHCASIEHIEAVETGGVTSDQLRRLLSSSPRLHTFIILENEGQIIPSVSHFLVDDFIDLDLDLDLDDDNDTKGGGGGGGGGSGCRRSLKPWACESTLRVFSAKILGIPRPDITVSYYNTPIPEDATIQETYPGQGLDLQQRVYERLARFSQLEALELGHDDRDLGGKYKYVQDATGNVIHDDRDEYQYSCVDMNLGSGLRVLVGLKQLKRLNVTRMATRIGVEEVGWMVENWSRLEELHGLNVEQEEVAAHEWVNEMCPSNLSHPFKFSWN